MQRTLDTCVATTGMLHLVKASQAILFPDKTELTYTEYILALRHTRAACLEAYIPIVAELAAAERHAELITELRALRQVPAVNDVPEPTPVEPAAMPEEHMATAEPSPDNQKLIDAIIESDEFRKYCGSGPSGLGGGALSYLIHTKQFELLDFALKSEKSYNRATVSAQLAIIGDLEGLIWLADADNDITWSTPDVVTFATARGHIPVLIWASCTLVDVDVLRGWKHAVINNRLNVVQWYFVSHTINVKKIVPEMIKYATDDGKHEIVDWIVSMGF